jgi:RNA polymerase primary sigma factor
MADVKNKKEYEKAVAAFIKEKKPMGRRSNG